MQKTCKGCKRELPIENFTKSKNTKDGYENKCKECRQLQRKKTHKLICQRCSKEFTSDRLSSKFCSEECQHLSHRNRIKTKCAFCNKDIEVIESKYKKFNQFYCDQQCRSEHLKTLMSGDNNANYMKIDYKCDGCGKSIKTDPYKIKSQKHIFCSNECYKANIGKYITGENSPLWNPYLTDEDRERRRTQEHCNWSFSVKERDDFSCQVCGNNKSGNLTSHHLNGYNWDKEHRYDIDNGVTLCKSCHKQFHYIYGYGNNVKEQYELFFLGMKIIQKILA